MRGDSAAQHAVRQVGDWIGFGVGNLVNIFNPEAVIFGGTLRDIYLVAAAQIRSRLNAIALPACREHVRLRTPELGTDAALIGAAELAFERLLDDPLCWPSCSTDQDQDQDSLGRGHRTRVGQPGPPLPPEAGSLRSLKRACVVALRVRACPSRTLSAPHAAVARRSAGSSTCSGLVWVGS